MEKTNPHQMSKIFTFTNGYLFTFRLFTYVVEEMASGLTDSKLDFLYIVAYPLTKSLIYIKKRKYQSLL